MNLSIDLSVINQNESFDSTQTTAAEMFDFSDDPLIFENIPKRKLERQWTLDKLMGRFSENFLQRVPAAIPAAIEARKSYLLKCLFDFFTLESKLH